MQSSGYLRTLDVPGGDTTFKAYMDYRTITDTSSKQWKLQQAAYTGDYGIREVDGRYCVAIGTGYGVGLGEELTVTLDSGKQFEIIVSDLKMDIHTDETCRYTPMSEGRKNVLEFIVHDDYLHEHTKLTGNLNHILQGNIEEMSYVE